MMNNALKGYNVSVLAYGQTNSGKTFTITGGKDNNGVFEPGIIHLTAEELFNTIEFLQTPKGIEKSIREKADTSFHLQASINEMENQPGANFAMMEPVAEQTEMEGTDGCSMINRSITISVSYMEIYNESVNDLLDKEKRNLDVRDHKGEVIVENLTCKTVKSTEEILQLVKLGEEIRIRAETKVNAKSTRSHTVFRINVLIDDRNEQTGRHEIRTSQI